jgi:quercetin dioxygenase-like cupin family protein
MKHWGEAKPVEMMPGVFRRTLAETADMMIIELRAQPGATVPLHSHPHQQITYVVSGQDELTVDGITHTLMPGDSCPVPGGVEHMAHFPVEAVVVECFTPPRAEYR